MILTGSAHEKALSRALVVAGAGGLQLDVDVTLAEWQNFVNEVVTPKFPAGLTIVDSAGQWRNAHGRIEQEPSKLLVLLHPRSAEIDAQIDEIRALYCQRFKQEAVMKVTSVAHVAF